MERQKHGFIFEEEMINKYNLVKTNNYTSQWDGEKEGKKYSIKVEKKGSDIELGDIFRNASIDYDFYMIVGFWERTKDNICESYLLKIDGEMWKNLFKDFSYFEEKFRDLLSNITNDISDDLKWKKEITALRAEWKNKTLNLIRPRFKRDHKKQKRIQCAINNKDFYNYFIKNYEVK